MKRCILITILFALMSTARAEWQFSSKIDVAPQHNGNKVFHHLDASGRASIAVSGQQLAVVWEDNHSGSPQVYIASKKLTANTFGKPVRLSTGQEAYEPCIVALTRGNFAIAWEQDGHIWLATGNAGNFAPARRLSSKAGRQVSLVPLSENKLLAAWSRIEGANTYIVTTSIALSKNTYTAGPVKTVNHYAKRHTQSYPVLGKVANDIGLIWEDRRRGHTMLMYTVTQDGKSFSKPQVLNEIVKKSDKHGKGSGVARIALTNYAQGQIAVTWMDKRNRQTGYDIFAAFGQGDKFVIGKNQQVQDSFGDNFAQWNPAITGNPQGDVAIAWYDNREESMDILLSTKTAEGWSDDHTVQPASGNGDQTNVVMSYDNQRNLHLVWIDQASQSSPTRLYYTIGRDR